MIVLPNTPPTPKPWNPTSSVLSPGLLAARASLDSLPSTHADSVRYVVKLEDYLEGIFSLLAASLSNTILLDYATKSLLLDLCKMIPWNNVCHKKKRDLNLLKSSPTVEWCLATEIQTTVVAASFMYSQLGAALINELIELDEMAQSKETDEKWKLVANFYKKALSLANFGAEFTGLCLTSVLLDPQLFILLDKIANVGIQMSILCKFSWANRNSFNEQDTFLSKNNGVLCRVAIWILDEVKACQNIVRELESLPGDLLDLNYTDWSQYLAVFVKYASAYAGLFLSIEYYQKDKMGQAIGLINFSLLSLQSKNLSEMKPKKSKVLARVKSKIAGKRNESYISSLQSITSLKIDKSVFQELSGVVLKDLTLLFDQLVQCHLKYTKENNNLNFDEVVDWQDIHSDSKWPFGSKIPVSDVAVYAPKVLAPAPSNGVNPNFTGRGSYF